MSFVASVNVKIRVWSFIANLFPNRIQEQYAKLKLMEEGLQAAQSNCSAREKAAEVRALFAVKGQKYICIQRTLLGFSEVHCPTLSSRSEGSLCFSQALEQQLTALQAEMEQLRQKEEPEEPSGFSAQLQDLQAQ